MGTEVWALVVPATTETLLLTLCVLVLRKLRRLCVSGVCELTLAAVMVDAVAQVWHMVGHAGRPAGMAWLLHVALSYLMVYILYRLGDVLCAGRVQEPVCVPVARRMTREGGKAEWMRS